LVHLLKTTQELITNVQKYQSTPDRGYIRGGLFVDIEKAFDAAYPVEDDIYGVSKHLISQELEDRGYWHEARKFLDCHRYFFVYACPTCATEYLIPLNCRFRFCNACGEVEINKLAFKYARVFSEKIEHIKTDPAYKYFSVKRLEMGLPPIEWLGIERFDDLREYFKKLRKIYLDKRFGDFGGGVYGLEVKFSRKGDIYQRCNGEMYVIPKTGFNFHLHAIVVSDYLPNKNPKPIFSWMWKKATGGLAKRAYVDEAKSWRNGFFETVKYVFKAPTLRTPENYVDFYEDTKRLHLHASFGSFHGVKLPKREKGRYGCRFDGAVLEKDSLSITRNEAIEKESNRIIPRQYLDAYTGGSKGVLRPVVLRGGAS
jgi:hypothetical protein